MIKFNPGNREELTTEDALSEIHKITSKTNADQFIKDYQAYILGELIKDRVVPPDGKTLEELALTMAKENIGYWGGYYGPEVRDKLERLFECEHPIFGSIKEKGSPSPQEAFEIGLKLGEDYARTVGKSLHKTVDN